VQAPEDEVMYYVNKLGEEKTPITDGGWYYPVIYPKSSYAAMITHLDAQVGKLIQKLKDLGIYENTMFVITSDNGPASNSNSPMDYFKSGGPFKCTKGWGKSTLQEGGIRMPFIVSFGSHLTPGTSNHVGQSVDLMPTFAELAGVEAPKNDGISFVPTLKGHKQPQHEYLYWEFPSSRGWVAVRWGNWKGLVRLVTKGNNKMELYDLQNDMLETTDLAEQHPEIVKQLWDFVKEAHQPVPNDVEKFKLDINFPE
jgi:arylsulfatase